MAAKYLVTVSPGVYLGPGFGFVKIGDIYTAPTEDHIPSRTCRPLNEEARLALEKRGVKAAIVVLPSAPTPRVEEGLTLRELGELPDAVAKGAIPEAGRPKGTRAADR